MIPKVIHYCWFGGNSLPSSAIKCINSWRKFFPDYEIKEWNEDNFDVGIIPYTAEAYSVKKYAFVSDYARFLILYKYGGLYFDTDVEVIKSMDDIIERGAFMGIETEATKHGKTWVAPGLGMGAKPKDEFYQEILNDYKNSHFFYENIYDTTTVGERTTSLLIKNGFNGRNELQCVDGIWIYPIEYFNPLEDSTGKLHVTPNTRSIHWYAKSWIDDNNPLRIKMTRLIHRFIGVKTTQWIKHNILKK